MVCIISEEMLQLLCLLFKMHKKLQTLLTPSDMQIIWLYIA